MNIMQSKNLKMRWGIFLTSSFILLKRKETSSSAESKSLNETHKFAWKFSKDCAKKKLLKMSSEEKSDNNSWYLIKGLTNIRRFLSTMVLAVQNTSLPLVDTIRKTSTSSSFNEGHYSIMNDENFKYLVRRLNSNQILFLLVSLSNEIAKYFDMDVLISDSDLETLIKSTTIAPIPNDFHRDLELNCYNIDGQLLAKLFASLVVYSKNEKFAEILAQRQDLIHQLLKVIHLNPLAEKQTPSPPTLKKTVTGSSIKTKDQNQEIFLDDLDEDGYRKKNSTDTRHYNINPTSDALEDILKYEAKPRDRNETTSSDFSLQQTDDDTLITERIYLNLDLQCQVELATFLANISRIPANLRLFKTDRIKKFLNTWKNSRSLHLNLISNKINLNTMSHTKNERKSESSSDDLNLLPEDLPHEPVYMNDIYRLDHDNTMKPLVKMAKTRVYKPNFQLIHEIRTCLGREKKYDIVFINGMNGSVFYTWRQHEKDQLIRSIDMGLNEIRDFKDLQENENYTKCWPRDWLSHKYPHCRIIGVNVSLKPFFWNSICPHDKKRRLIRDRAIDLAVQLRQSGVGDRPIIWISHSAGGIIVKEILRFINDKEYLNAYLDTMENNHKKRTDKIERKPSTIKSLLVKPYQRRLTDEMTLDDISDLSNGLHEIQTEFIEREISSHYFQKFHAEIRIPSRLREPHERIRHQFLHSQMHKMSDNTKGLLFISTPHRGNQSLYTLYHYPFKFALSPEAKELERNGPAITELHEWFLGWLPRRKIHVVNMIETEPTKCNNLYSCILVPEDPLDQDYSEIIRINSDHIYISKPNSTNDKQFTEISKFLTKNFPGS